MIKRLKLRITMVITLFSTALIIFFLYSTYSTTQRNLENTCNTDMSFILSDISAVDSSTYPIAVLTVNYTGKIELLLNHLPAYNKDEIMSYAAEVLKKGNSTGELSPTLRYMRKSIGYSNIRIALTDVTSEKTILRTQIRNSIFIGIFSIIGFLVLGFIISTLVASPIEKAMLAQKQFIADASHELKTPLTVIISNIDMIPSDEISERNHARIVNIQSEARRMKSLVEGLLQIARYDSTLLPTMHKIVDISHIIQCAIAIYDPIAFEKGLTISSNISENLFVNGDEQKLEQLIRIFLDNSMKYSFPASIISVQLFPFGNSYAKLTISNQGIPLTDDDLKHIFSSFYRSAATASSIEGNGLGLAIAYKICEEHKFKIWAESNVSSQTNNFYVLFRTINPNTTESF